VLGALDIWFGRYLAYTVLLHPESGLPSISRVASFVGGTWLGSALAVVLAFIVFPTGAPSSTFMKRTAFVLGALAVLSFVAIATKPGNLAPPFDTLRNALAVERPTGLGHLIDNGPLIGLVVVTGIAAGDLLMRFRRSTGDERAQFKWLAYVACWLPILMLAYLLIDAFAPSVLGVVTALIVLIGFGISIAIGIAILKYRLYDIELLINRTLVYVPLTAILAGLFGAVTGLLRAVFTESTGLASDVVVAASTLVVIAALTPVKNQLQVLVDRRFKEPADPVANLKKRTSDIETVVQVLDSTRLLQTFLEDAVAATRAHAGRLMIHGPYGHLITQGRWDGHADTTVPLVAQEREIGVLALATTRQLPDATLEALQRSSEAVARAIALRGSTQEETPAAAIDGEIPKDATPVGETTAKVGRTDRVRAVSSPADPYWSGSPRLIRSLEARARTCDLVGTGGCCLAFLPHVTGVLCRIGSTPKRPIGCSKYARCISLKEEYDEGTLEHHDAFRG
jgi:hypothetical protein